VPSVHQLMIHTLSSTAAFKIIENHNGVAFIQVAQQVQVLAPVQQQKQPHEPPQQPQRPTDPATSDPNIHATTLEPVA
jgi:hypothetical protein